MQTKGTNGYVKIPRAVSPVKAKKEQVGDKGQSTHLPRVANKYMLGNRKISPTVNVPHTVDDKSDQSETKHPGKRSVTETTEVPNEPFRPRASTFPGKIQRPMTTIQKIMKDRDRIEVNEKSDGSAKTRVFRTKTDPLSHSKRDDVDNTPGSPTSRRGSHGSTSPTQRQSLQYRKHSSIQRRIMTAHKAKEDEMSKDSIQEEDVSFSACKHVLVRRTNKFTRVSAGSHTAREETVVEQVTELTPPRPSSTVTFRSATPVLPSLMLQNENGKRNP